MPLKVKSNVITSKKKRKPPARVTLKYRGSTLSKLDKSIALADERYKGDSSIMSAPNFRVVKPNLDDPKLEEVLCSIKVGKKKWKILENSSGTLVDQVKIAGSDVMQELTGFREFVNSLKLNSGDEKAFNQLAIDQAWPPQDQVQKERYFYDSESDQILKKVSQD